MKNIVTRLSSIITLDKLANVAVICVAVMLGAVVVKNHLLGGSNSPATARTKAELVGRQIKIPAPILGKTSASVALALSTNCHFCTESMPFYKQLTEMKQGSETSFQLFTFFPQDAAEANAYLNEHGVSPDLIMSGPKSFSGIGVTGTPALLIVNEKGVIQEAWLGKLSEKEQAEVISKLKSASVARSSL
jgi:hypothetical protein